MQEEEGVCSNSGRWRWGELTTRLAYHPPSCTPLLIALSPHDVSMYLLFPCLSAASLPRLTASLPHYSSTPHSLPPLHYYYWPALPALLLLHYYCTTTALLLHYYCTTTALQYCNCWVVCLVCKSTRDNCHSSTPSLHRLPAAHSLTRTLDLSSSWLKKTR